MTPLLVVHGTWGRAAAWFRPGSPFLRAVGAAGLTPVRFCWSGILAGVPTRLPGDPDFATIGADAGRLLPWLDAGEKLALFIRQQRRQRDDWARAPHVLSHSHGLQVVAMAAALGMVFDVAVSVSGPVRRDMQRARRKARGNIFRWIQYADPELDKTIDEGEWFDGGDLHATIELPEGETTVTPGSGHSGLLEHADTELARYHVLEQFPLNG